MLAQQERSRIYGSAADFEPPLYSPTPIRQAPGADDSGHFHRLSQRGYQGGSPFGQASQASLASHQSIQFPEAYLIRSVAREAIRRYRRNQLSRCS